MCESVNMAFRMGVDMDMCLNTAFNITVHQSYLNLQLACRNTWFDVYKRANTTDWCHTYFLILAESGVYLNIDSLDDSPKSLKDVLQSQLQSRTMTMQKSQTSVGSLIASVGMTHISSYFTQSCEVVRK